MVSIVTGAAGFIGSSLAEKLLAIGHKVVGIDCFIDYYPRRLKEKNLEGLLTNKDFQFIEADILDINFDNLLKETRFIFHQAAQAGVRASWGKDFDIYINNNIKATQHILESFKGAHNLEKLIFASSSSVYGDMADIPMKEESCPIPVSPYGVTKLASEELCYLYWKNYDIPVVSLRYFTVYGPRQRPDMAFNRFIRALMTNSEITIYGDGTQTRDFTFISDIVDANISAALKGDSGVTYNIGGGTRIGLLETINILGEISGLEPSVNFMENQRGDMKHTFADTARAVKDLDYKPKIDLKTGLSKEFEWLNNINKDLLENL